MIGWHNPIPFQIGGGPTEDELVYEALKRAVGEGGYAKDETGIDGLDRAIEAGMLSTINQASERAALQAFPSTATDHLSLHEDYLGIVASEEDTDVARRQAVADQLTLVADASEPSLAVQLARIDARASLLSVPHNLTAVVVLGKAFEPQDSTPTYGPMRGTGYPNYSSEFYVPVLLNLGYVTPTPADLLAIQRIKRLMREALPSWVHFSVITTPGPFILGVSLVGITPVT